MIKTRKYAAVALSLMLAGSLAACGEADATENTSASASIESEQTEVKNTISFSDESYSETTFSGTVSAIDDNFITLTIVDMSAFGDFDMSQGGMEMPGGQGGDMGEVPEMPSGDNNMGQGGDMNGAPEMPTGDNNGQGGDMNQGGDMGDAPELPDGAEMPEGMELPDGMEMPEGMEDFDLSDQVTALIVINDTSVLKDSDGNAVELSDISMGTSLTVTLDDNGEIESIVVSSGFGNMGDFDMSQGGMGQGGMGMPGSMSSGVDSYTAVTEYTEDTETTGETYESTGTDENAVLVSNGASVTLNNATVTRNSSDSTGGDNSSFYGVGAAVLATDGTVTLNDGTVTTDAAGGAGVFAYGSGVAYVDGVTISTEQNTSGGIHVAGGGTLYAWDCDVTTQGESAAAIRSDRGGGTMVVDGGTYTSNGVGSPAVYCTADITINDATLTANGSEAVCIEGLNSLRLYDCDLTGNMSDSSQNDCTWNIIVYQSMSGDSEVGNGVFAMKGGSITAKNGGIFYTTNTESTIYLSDVDITAYEDGAFLLQCTGNTNQRGWGTSGSNGAQCVFTADSQTMSGNVIYDSISTLDFYMENGSSLTGAFVDDETWAGNGGNGYCNVYISADSTWTVTADSTVTALYNAGTIKDATGNTVSIVGTDGTVYVSGTSAYTITVSTYSDSADLSGAYTLPAYSEYQVSKN